MVAAVSADDRRTLIALMCKVAWADGVVDEAEAPIAPVLMGDVLVALLLRSEEILRG